MVVGCLFSRVYEIDAPRDGSSVVDSSFSHGENEGRQLGGWPWPRPWKRRRKGRSYMTRTDEKWASVREEVIRVPEGHCWVQGDNLEWSRDSRLFGPLPLGLVKSKVLAVILPFREAKWVGSKVDVVEPQQVERDWVMK